MESELWYGGLLIIKREDYLYSQWMNENGETVTG